jgi:hypothetical protein
MPFAPEYSIGEPRGKKIIVVGLNPSGHIDKKHPRDSQSSIEERRASQLGYFERTRFYSYFENLSRFFGKGKGYESSALKRIIGWNKHPYEQVGVLDLVKCATVNLEVGGQWTSLKGLHRAEMVRNCEGYLKAQLAEYTPTLVIPYGSEVIKWFEPLSGGKIKHFTKYCASIGSYSFKGIAIPQRQGPHSAPEVKWVQDRLLELL